MSNDKKGRERALLLEAMDLYGGFPASEPQDWESPDFLFTINTGQLGVELVDYVRGQGPKGSPEREAEGSREKFAKICQAEYEKQSSIRLMVHFLWLPSKAAPRLADAAKLVAKVVDLIVANTPETIFVAKRLGDEYFEGSGLDGLLTSITVTRVRNSGQVLWSPTDVGFTYVPENAIEGLVAFKDAKYDDYRKLCEEVWLLIVADGWRISSSVDLLSINLDPDFSPRFERVLLYARESRTVKVLHHKY